MWRILCSVLMVLPMGAAVYHCQSTGTGASNWSNPAAWTACNGTYPHNNGADSYTADIVTNRAFTLDVSITIGEAGAVDASGPGTVSASSSTTVTGTGTTFTTTFIPGDTFLAGGITRTVQSVTDDTHLVISPITTLSGSYTYRRHAIWFSSTSATVSSASNVTLTLNGDMNLPASWTMADGTTISLSGKPYRVYVGAGELGQQGYLIINGTSGNRSSVTSDSGGYLYGVSGNDFEAHYVDFSGLGSASQFGIGFNPNAGKSFQIDHSTFTSIGQIATSPGGSIPLSANFVFTNNRLISVASGVPAIFTFMNIACAAGTPTGARTITNNSLVLPGQALQYSSQVSAVGFTFRENVLDRVGASGSGPSSPLADVGDNLFVFRNGDTTATWSFIGQGGDTLHDLYFLSDEGPSQANQRAVMSNDSPSVAGTWTLTNYVYERSANLNFDVTHPGSPPTAATTYVWKNILVLPSSVGKGSGSFRLRGNANTTINLNHVTGLADGPDPGTGNTGGLLVSGNQYGGFANMIASLANNLSWQSTTWSGAGAMGFLATYSTAYTVADLLASGAVANNATYNATTGNFYDASGANPTPALGYTLFRQTVKPTLASDINLGTGSDVTKQGPRFADPTRNIATFDTAYLKNTAAAWQNAHAYSVGDIASNADAASYGGATINYRCVTAHTSASGDTTNGAPGSAAATNYRVNWEFASVARIRDAVVAASRITDGAIGCSNCSYVTALSNWVRRGFVPQNPILWCAGTDGETIGAVPFCKAGKAMVGAIQ